MTPRGCLETGAITLFALILGAFAMSTWYRYVENRSLPPDSPDTSSHSPMAPAERARIRVQVLNGSGEPGQAERLTEYLRRRGFDVVEFGNAESFDHRHTVVIDRVGDPRDAREVAATLRGVPIHSRPDSSLILDVTVLVGSDLESRLLEDRATESGEARWREWLRRIPRPWR